MVTNFNERSLQKLPLRECDYFVWDPTLSGFGVRIRKGGSRTYICQYRTEDRRQRRMGLGAVGVERLENARDRARQLLAAAHRGEDPQNERHKRRNSPTIAALADRYLAEHVELHNRVSTAREVRRLVEVLIKPKLGDVQTTKLTRAEIKAWHATMRKTPISANRALAALSKMMSLAARDWELRPDNPCQGVKKFGEQKRERFFSDGELKEIGEALAKAEAERTILPGAARCVRLLALTGMRLGEVLGLRWEDVDMAASAIRLRDAKAGARSVALGARALAYLQALPRDAEFVCPAPRRDLPLSRDTMERIWSRLRQAANLSNARLHDFRHTAGTYAAQTGANAFLVRDLLGHKTLAMTARYVERVVDPVKITADAMSNRVAAAMDGEPESKILPLRKTSGPKSL